MSPSSDPAAALARLVAAVEEVKAAAALVTTSRDHLIEARNAMQAALEAGVVLIGESAHDHGNCELCDELELERDALRSTVADLTASLKVAQETIRQREAAQRAAEERLETQIQAAYVAQEAQLAQGWTLHEAEEQIAALRAGLIELFALVNEGRLVRDTSADADTATYLAQSVRLVKALASVKELLGGLDAARG